MSTKKGFNLKDLLNDNSKGNKVDNVESRAVEMFEVKQIDISDIVPSKENFYSVKDIKNIKNSIELLGIEQNLIVEKLQTGKFKLLAGHRRYFASKSLVEEGKEKYRILPCRVKEVESDILNKLTMIMTNSTARELSDYEKMHQTLEIEELVIQLKKDMKLPGRTRDLLSEIVSVSPSQLGRYKAIKNNLIYELMEEFKVGNIQGSVAYKASGLSQEYQRILMAILEREGSLSLLDVESIKAQETSNKQLDGQVDINSLDEDVIKTQCNVIEEYEEDNTLIEQKLGGKIEVTVIDEVAMVTKEELQEPVSEEEDVNHIEDKSNNNNNSSKKGEIVNSSCSFCSKDNFKSIGTEEGTIGISHNSDNNKLEIINRETGEIQHLKISYCFICGRKLG